MLAEHNTRVAEIKAKAKTDAGTKNDVAQEFAARIAEEKDFTETQITLIKQRVAQGLLSEEQGATETLDLQKQHFAAQTKLLTDQLGKTKDVGDRAKIGQELKAVANDAEKAQSAYATALSKMAQERDKYQRNVLTSIDNSTYKTEQENEALRAQIDVLGLTDKQLGEYEAAKVRAAAAAEYLDAANLREAASQMEASGVVSEAIAYYRQLADAREAAGRALDQKSLLESEKGVKKAAVDAAAEWKKTSDKISDNITDALMRGFESGKTVAENLRDSVANMFSTMVLRPVVQATVMGGASAVGLGSSDGSVSTSSAGSLGSIGTLASGAKSAYDIFTGGAADTYSSMARSSIGQQLGLSTSGTIYEASSDTLFSGVQITDLGRNIGTGLAYSGAGLIGSAIGNAIAGDKRIIDGVSSSTIGATIGALAGPLGAGIGGVVGGLLDAAFGSGDVEYTDAGIRGTFSGASFSGEKFQNWEQDGGWFGGDDSGTDTLPIDASTLNSLSASFTLLKLQTGQLAAGLGVDTANIAAYSKDINLTLTSDASANATAISNMIAGIGEDMSSLVLAGMNFGLAGETSSETLSRLYNSLTTVNQAFDSLKISAYETSLAGGDMASQLVTAMGGIDAFKTSVASYYDTYTSAEEKQADLVRQTTTAIQALGVAVPENKAAFDALVKSLDMTTDSGRTTFAGLMSVEVAFAQMKDTEDALSESAKKAAAAVATANAALLKSAQDAIGATVDADYSSLERAISAQKAAVDAAYESQNSINQAAIEASTKIRDNLSGLADTLKSAVGTIVADADENLLSSRNAAQTVLNDAYAASQSGLSLAPYSDSIKSAIAELSKPADQVYATYEEYARAQGRANAVISVLNIAAGDQLDVADLTLDAIKDAADAAEAQHAADIAALDAILTNAESQINVLRGIDGSILSVADAIKALAASLGAAAGTKTTPAAQTVGAWTSTADGRYYQSSAGAVLTQAAGSSDVIVHAKNGESATVAQTVAAANSLDANSLYAATKNAGLTLSELDQMMGWAAGHAEAWAVANNLPKFDIGTNYVPYDMTAKIHQGERIFPAADNRALMSRLAANDSGTTARLETLVGALTEKFTSLLSSSDKTAANTAALEQFLRRISSDGESINVLVAA